MKDNIKNMNLERIYAWKMDQINLVSPNDFINRRILSESELMEIKLSEKKF